jgi:hypothetical protein
MAIIIVSQVRDKIGFVVGEKHRRSGGKALDFYATHILWLAHLKTLVRTIGGEKRPTGILVRANCKKNKVSLPFRKCEFPIRFGYGVDDVEASVEWLVEQRMNDKLGIKVKEKDDFLDDIAELAPAEYAKRAEQIRAALMQGWAELEEQFKPTRQKYT